MDGQQLGQPLTGVAAPAVQQRCTRTPHELDVSGDHPQVEQSDSGTQLTSGDVSAFRRRAYGMINSNPRVPERIPQITCQLVDLGRGLAMVQ